MRFCKKKITATLISYLLGTLLCADVELSTFSLKKDNLLIKIPKVWKWKYSKRDDSKIRFKAKSRNGLYYYLIKRVSVDEPNTILIQENRLEILDCDITKEEIQLIRLNRAELFKYRRKSKEGYLMTYIDKNFKYLIIFELNSNIIEANRGLTLDILNGVKPIE